MATNKINEATTVASSRSRLGKRKDNTKLKAGVPARNGSAREKKIISIINGEGENVFGDFAKFLEQQLNEYVEKEIKKKLN